MPSYSRNSSYSRNLLYSKNLSNSKANYCIQSLISYKDWFANSNDDLHYPMFSAPVTIKSYLNAPSPITTFNGLVNDFNIKPGLFLTPPQYLQAHPDITFNQEMGKVAIDLVAKLRNIGTRNLDEIQIADLLKEIATKRQELAKTGFKHPDQRAEIYGYPCPTSVREYVTYLKDVCRSALGKYSSYEEKAKNDLKRRGTFGDYITISKRDRHSFIYAKASQYVSELRKPKSWSSVQINREVIELSVICKEEDGYFPGNLVDGQPELVVLHPSLENMHKIRKLAYTILKEAFQSQPWNLDKVAEGYRLLCHATPFVNGSPSIIETFIDAMFRSIGMAFPMKSSEPFWDAIFHKDSDGPYTWKRFMQNFNSSISNYSLFQNYGQVKLFN